MDYLLICTVALLASLLTLFSGFGLGTLLLPAFALFVPLPLAVAATALVHLANNLFKGGLLGRHADRGVLLRFLPAAAVAALLGAWLLGRLGAAEPLLRYQLADRDFLVEPLKLVIGLLIIAFALIEQSRRFQALALPRRWLPLGGLVSGFFGGLSGHQGALRSLFLIKCGLSPQAFVATGVITAIAVDVSRLLVYGSGTIPALQDVDAGLLRLVFAASLAAFAGAWLGARWLRKTTLGTLQRIVSIGLMVVGTALAAGWI